MNKFPKMPSVPVEKPLPPAEEMVEDYDSWLEFYPAPVVPQLSIEGCDEQIAEFHSMCEAFERTYDLEALRSINSFASVEERKNSIREPAMQALAPIFQIWKNLKAQSLVSKPTIDELKAKHDALWAAVGVVSADPAGMVFEIVNHG